MKKIIITFLGIVFIQFNIGCSSNQPPIYPYSTIDKSTYTPNYYVSKNDFIKDINQYLTLVIEVHAEPYRLIPKSDLQKFADSIKADILNQPTDSIHLLDCFFYLQLLSTKIKDGHTLIRKPKNWRKLFSSQFPLILQNVNDTLVISKNLGNEKIPKNAKLLSVNENDIATLKKQSLKYISSTLPHHRTTSWAKDFPFLLQTFFNIQAPWVIKYEFEDLISIDTINGLPHEEYINKYLDDYYSNQITIKTFQTDSLTIPILKLSAFNYSSYSEYTALIDSFFSNYGNEKQIVIDVRDNTGGNGLWSLYLLDYFTNKRYSTYKTYKNRISSQFKEWAKYQLNSYYFSEGKSTNLFWYYRLFEDELYYKEILKSKNQTYVELDEQYHIPHHKKYNGDIFLLTSEKTWSAGVVFAAIFDSENMGTVVGSETGGRIGFNSDPINIELTHTKLVAKIPTAILVLPNGNKDNGLIPDVNANMSIKELQKGTDPCMIIITNELNTKTK